MLRLLVGFLAISAWAAGSPRQEHIRYVVNWPTGLSLGEGELRASRENGNWKLEFSLDASVPGFDVKDRFRSIATEALCSVFLEKDSKHGSRKRKETTTFSPATSTAVRRTENGGGKSEFATPACAHDALTYLFRVRDELNRGRTPAPQQIFFGAAYDIRMKLIGGKRIMISEAPVDTDHFRFTVKGQASLVEFDAYFTRDDSRTLALVKVPFAMGTFSLEWVR